MLNLPKMMLKTWRESIEGEQVQNAIKYNT